MEMSGIHNKTSFQPHSLPVDALYLFCVNAAMKSAVLFLGT